MPNPTNGERTLLLRLAGPLQSWGLTGQFIERDTAPYPSKSGVIGLIAGALGRHRGADVSDLVALPFGVRVDRPGVLLHDYHTISRYDGQPLRSADGGITDKNLVKPTHRYYLADAVFVVGLASSASGQLDALDAALRRPVYAPFLGRKSCVPAGPVNLGIHDGNLNHALSSVDWQGGEPNDSARPAGKLHVIVEDQHGIDLISDVPVNFAPQQRAFQSRRISHTYVDLADPSGEQPETHDPFSLIGW